MFEKDDSSNRKKKISGCSFQQVLQQKLSWFFLNRRKRFLGFILKPTERSLVLLKNGIRDSQNSLSFGKSHIFM